MAIVNYKCNDGTFENRDTDYQGRQDVPCRRNGGVSNNQPVVNAPAKEVVSQDSEDKFWRSLGFTQSDMIKPKHKGRFYLVVVLVGGYFAYKKFKK